MNVRSHRIHQTLANMYSSPDVSTCHGQCTQILFWAAPSSVGTAIPIRILWGYVSKLMYLHSVISNMLFNKYVYSYQQSAALTIYQELSFISAIFIMHTTSQNI